MSSASSGQIFQYMASFPGYSYPQSSAQIEMGQGSKFTSHWYDKVECPNCVHAKCNWAYFEKGGECVWREYVNLFKNELKIKKWLLSVNPAADK